MDVPEKLLKFKYHALGVVIILLLFALLQALPSFLSVLSFFWPLLLSTALFLVVMAVFGRTSSAPTDVPGRSARKTKEGSVGSSIAGEERGALEFLTEQQEGGRFMFDSILGLAGESPGKQVGSPEEHREYTR